MRKCNIFASLPYANLERRSPTASLSGCFVNSYKKLQRKLQFSKVTFLRASAALRGSTVNLQVCIANFVICAMICYCVYNIKGTNFLLFFDVVPKTLRFLIFPFLKKPYSLISSKKISTFILY